MSDSKGSKDHIPTKLPQQGGEDKQENWSEWGSRNYSEQKEKWGPWLEDQYLRFFGKDNKASYVTKQQLDKSKVTGISQIDNLQDGVNNLAAGQVGKGGLLQPVGDWASKEGVDRAERGGKDDKGNWAPGPASKIANPVAENVKGGAGKVMDGAKGAGGYVSGLWGGGKKEEDGKGKK